MNRVVGMKQKRLVRGLAKGLAGATIAALILAGCGNANGGTNNGTNKVDDSSATAAGKLKVLATFYPMVEFTRQVAGEHADVVGLVPTGTEPHDWEPTPKDVVAIQEADLFIYNGLVEGWAEKTLESAKSDKRIDVKTIEGLNLIEGSADHDHHHDHANEEQDHDHDHDHATEDHDHEHATEEHDHDHSADSHDEHHDNDGHAHKDEAAETVTATDDHHADEHKKADADTGVAANEDQHEHAHEDGEHALDPHVWLSPALAQQQVRHIQAGLTQADPAHKDDYQKNADAYIKKLEALDAKYKEQLSQTKRKDFITQHAAFGYLAKQYGLTQIPIAGLSPEQEPSADEMAKVVAFAREHQVKTIFFETLVDPKIAQTIADEIGAKTDVLNPLEGLTDEDINKGLDYISIMELNLAGLVKALNE